MSVNSQSNGQLANNSRRSWISTAVFNNDIFSYSTSMNMSTFQTVGTLGPVTGATAQNCPAGRVLRENGKKLYPEAHNGVSTYMVGVFDPVSFLSGFIDPNSPIFAVYNTDKPAALDTAFLAGGVNPNGGAFDLAPPVYTAGTVTAVGNITSTNGDIEATLGNISAGTYVEAGTTVTAGTGITSTTGDITALDGNVIAAKQIRSGFNNTGLVHVFNGAVGSTLDYLIDINTYPTQNITISASGINPQVGSIVNGCTFYFTSNGTAGDMIRLWVTITGTNSLQLDTSGNVFNAANIYTITAPPGGVGSRRSVLTYVSDGNAWFLTAFTAGL